MIIQGQEQPKSDKNRRNEWVEREREWEREREKECIGCRGVWFLVYTYRLDEGRDVH